MTAPLLPAGAQPPAGRLFALRNAAIALAVLVAARP